jgi:hypothetical protein
METTYSVREEECAICLDKLTKGRNYCSTECGHNYHTSCLLKTNNICPICRHVLLQNDANLDRSNEMQQLHEYINELEQQTLNRSNEMQTRLQQLYARIGEIDNKLDTELDMYDIDETPEMYFKRRERQHLNDDCDVK